MSTLESLMWHVLGYAAIPIILLSGIVVATLFYLLMIRIAGQKSDD